MAPRARATRHKMLGSMPAPYMIVITMIEKTSPRPNMPCQREPIRSRELFGIDSMM